MFVVIPIVQNETLYEVIFPRLINVWLFLKTQKLLSVACHPARDVSALSAFTFQTLITAGGGI